MAMVRLFRALIYFRLSCFSGPALNTKCQHFKNPNQKSLYPWEKNSFDNLSSFFIDFVHSIILIQAEIIPTEYLCSLNKFFLLYVVFEKSFLMLTFWQLGCI